METGDLSLRSPPSLFLDPGLRRMTGSARQGPRVFAPEREGTHLGCGWFWFETRFPLTGLTHRTIKAPHAL